MPTVSISPATTEEHYSNYLQFIVTLSEPSVDVVTMNYRTLLNGTADDFDLYYRTTDGRNNGTVTFAPGETSATIMIRSSADSIDEMDESITLELNNLSPNAEFENGELVSRVFGTVLDDDAEGSNLAVFVSDPVIVEGDDGAREAVFDIVLSQPASSQFTLSYNTADGSALAGLDYTATNGTLTFLSGQRTAQVRVPVTTDMTSETSEYFSLVVTPPDSPVIDDTGAVGTALILDDDSGPGPTLSITGGATIEHYSDYVRFTLSLSEPAVDAVSVDYRLLLDQTASDYDLYGWSSDSSNNGTATFAPGQTTTDVFIRLQSDSDDERDGAFTLELVNLSDNANFAGGDNSVSARGFMLDDDGVGPNAILEVSDPVLTEADNGTQYAVFDIQLSRPADTAFTVDYETADITALAGSDYVALSGILSFKPGQDHASVRVQVLGDTTGEFTESFALNLTPSDNVSLGTAGLSGQATLIDNDTGIGTQPVVSITNVVETAEHYSGYLRYIVTLSQPSDEAVTVDYSTQLGTALDSDLYYGSSTDSNNGTLTFEAGETSRSIYIRAASDTEDERDESVFLTLRNASGAVLAGGSDSLTATNFIRDDDGVGLNIAAAGQPMTVGEPAEGVATITVPVTLSRAPDSELTLNVVVNGGTASNGSDFSLITNQLTFAAGQTDGAVVMQVNADFLNENPETIVLNYQPATGSSFAGVIPEHTITLTNYAQATEGDDTLTGSDGDDSIDALGGNDRVSGLDGNDSLSGGDGTDTISGGAGDDTLIGGTSENDLRDVIYGGDGDDSIDGGYGNDELRGESGNDTISGGFGVDTVIGAAGDDVLTGQAWSDLIFGGDGDDFVNGGFGYDRVNGGDGADRFFHLGVYDHGSDWIQDYTAADGDVLVFGQSGATADQFQVNLTETANAGVAGVEEAFVIYRPTGQIMWALVDGGAQGEINILIDGTEYNLLV
ncbi:Hemolysin, chromosomal [Thalassovita gelatinovora]|uniref:Hemolysin, chromosomal n=1 Tax=Thalassovita gelatinovora TaxID=53501 RepID=A0A0N7LW66_THAGE|nr:Calx-beta domain-containing protein [Thalassovita gelatinovora]QIZ81698.1 hypothetical protein HFZ77_15045 [Thalassovita gelatinovora]CUH68242.1 Hemolysin, chromosomal [Thalassovita gelatinovora]SEQ31938.1 Hemolysin-type calcium-binding repeat-containing protein [Thalassovita gelatinovora]